MFKRTIQILVGFAFAAQLTGCFFEDRDHRDHYDHPEHHEDHDHDAGVDVHLHD
jgi:hypothetical protein